MIEGYVLRLLRYAAPEEHREFTVDLSASLTDAFQKDAEAYLKDESIENALLKDAIIDESVKEMESIAYLKYLPDFVVECYTSNFGYPITYVPTGEFNDNGTEKMEVIEVKVYNPDVYVYKDAKMGTNSNLVEKPAQGANHRGALSGKDHRHRQGGRERRLIHGEGGSRILLRRLPQAL